VIECSEFLVDELFGVDVGYQIVMYCL